MPRRIAALLCTSRISASMYMYLICRPHDSYATLGKVLAVSYAEAMLDKQRLDVYAIAGTAGLQKSTQPSIQDETNNLRGRARQS